MPVAPRNPARAWPLERIARGVWGTVAVFLLVRILVQGDRRNSVYPVFAAAARRWLEGGDLYAPGSGFRYPPPAAVLLVPFELAGDLPGSLLWRALNLGAFLGAVWWAMRAGLPAPWSSARRGAFALLLVLPSVSSLNNGQSNGLLLGALMASAVAAGRRRWVLAAALATLPVLLKVYPLAFGALLTLVWPLRFGAPFAICTLLAFLAPFLLQDPAWVKAQYTTLIEQLRAEDRIADFHNAYRDLRLLLSWSGVALSRAAWTVVQLAAGGACAVWILWLRRRGLAPRLVAAWAFALSTWWMTLFGPATEKATYMLVGPALCWLLVTARRSARLEWGLALAAYATFVLTQLASQIPRSVRSGWPGLRVLLPFGAVLLGLALWRTARRDPAGSPCGTGPPGEP